jgi:hypothetical protein
MDSIQSCSLRFTVHCRHVTWQLNWDYPHARTHACTHARVCLGLLFLELDCEYKTMSFFHVWKNVTSGSYCPNIRYVAYNTRRALTFIVTPRSVSATTRCGFVVAQTTPNGTSHWSVLASIPPDQMYYTLFFSLPSGQFEPVLGFVQITVNSLFIFNVSTRTSTLQLHTVYGVFHKEDRRQCSGFIACCIRGK